ncbi:hypothetical protein RCL1_000085 [Eukaryota sp. TZLM3-RCL]
MVPEVSNLSIETIVSQRDSLPSCPITLGPLDQLAGTPVPIAVVFIYRHSVQVDRLTTALKLLLNHYRVLSGHFQINPSDGSFQVSEFSSGARLHLAECQNPLESYSNNDRLVVTNLPNGGNDLFAPFDPSLEGFLRDPILTVKHTRFTCGGTALGVRIHHVACDGVGFFQFTRHLAEIYNKLKHTDTPQLNQLPCCEPFMNSLDMSEEDRVAALLCKPKSMLIDGEQDKVLPEEQPLSNISQKVDVPFYPVIGKILRLSFKQIQFIKDMATNPNNSNAWVSSFDALSAFFHQLVHKARIDFYQNTGQTVSPPDFLTSINLRGTRLSQLSPEYFYNGVLVPYDSIDPTELYSAPLWVVASKWHNLTRQQYSTEEEVLNLLNWINAVPNKREIRTHFRFGNGCFMTSDWSKFDTYESLKLDSERPLLVAPPFTPGTYVDGLAYFLPTEKQGLDGEESKDVDVRLALIEPVWDLLEKSEVLKSVLSL